MTSIKGYDHIPPDLIARVKAEFPDLRPDILFGFAFGPPQGADMSWAEQFVVKDEVAELLVDPFDSENFIDRLAMALTGPALAIADERREKLKRLRAAVIAKDDETSLRIAAELCGVPREKGNRTHPRIH